MSLKIVYKIRWKKMRNFDGIMVDLNYSHWLTAIKVIKSQKLVVFWLTVKFELTF